LTARKLRACGPRDRDPHIAGRVVGDVAEAGRVAGVGARRYDLAFRVERFLGDQFPDAGEYTSTRAGGTFCQTTDVE